ncbi:hypothetical protein GSY69_13915, partial [Brevibacterium sp. 5221]|nr:hypothetical protein [Brevibacterium rongguiense]
PAFEAVEISDLSLNDNPTRAIRTLHRSDPRRPGVLLRRYDTTFVPYTAKRATPFASAFCVSPNGKIERFHRTLAEGWAYARFYSSETE